MTPRRIQLKRTKGWRKPEGAIVVARPTRFGNPFVVGDAEVQVTTSDGYIAVLKMTPEIAVDCYRDLMHSRLFEFDSNNLEDVVYVEQWREDLRSLRGHDLACWCPLDQPCHADVLLELANGDNL